MKIYSYCSYEGSQCGFVPGSFEFDTKADDQQGTRFILQNKPVLPIIQSVFECGSVDFAFGNLPDPNTYWIVVKELNAKNEKPYRYLNFAFETKDLREYKTLLAGILEGYNDREKLIQRFSDFVVIRKENTDFGLLICASAVQEFWNDCVKASRSFAIPKELQINEQIYLFRKMLSDTENKDRSKEIEAALHMEKEYIVVHKEAQHCHIVVRGVSKFLKSRISEFKGFKERTIDDRR